ncbi:cysteine peptidase family C39 domain-containing protein [Nitritalea halalkaliphila]|uniref:cysteine peptidase family C39 domain-containing protein n=1 Tax=Nitritalea halalkaliphila TaxID=590849 RepID=UPI0021CD7838|nr:cysteine peptidase family C39 domain-containing protein [Nitritalea halalkaliphila]
MKTSFPFYKQPDTKDCGPTCLRIVAKHYGKLISLKEIREISETTREGGLAPYYSDFIIFDIALSLHFVRYLPSVGNDRR